MKPGGVHSAGLKAGDAEGRDAFWLSFTCLAKDDAKAAHGPGWEVVRLRDYRGGGFAGMGFAGNQGLGWRSTCDGWTPCGDGPGAFRERER